MQLRSFVLHSQHPRFLFEAAHGPSIMGRSALAILLGLSLSGSPVLALGLGATGAHSASELTALTDSGTSDTSDWLMAQGFSPPDGRGMPGRREGGGTRGGLVIQGTPPTALIPISNLGTTLAEHPTFYFYVPLETAGLNVEMVLLDSDGNTVYQATAPLPSEEGIVSVSLPSNVALEPEHLYQWFFSVVVSEDEPSANVILSGWIRRVTETPELAQQLAAIAPSEQPAAYVDAGLWYDALDALVKLRRANPSDATVQSQWSALLDSVELGAIAPSPLLSDLPVSVSTGE